MNYLAALLVYEFTENQVEEPIIYAIDDLLMKPYADDPNYADRSSPYTDFHVPMDCVGNLLMVWNFFTSFGRLLHLWPFTLEDKMLSLTTIVNLCLFWNLIQQFLSFSLGMVVTISRLFKTRDEEQIRIVRSHSYYKTRTSGRVISSKSIVASYRIPHLVYNRTEDGIPREDVWIGNCITRIEGTSITFVMGIA